mgnify:CR=1 FL=1
MDPLMLFITIATAAVYLALGLLVLLRCETHYPAAMNDVVGFSVTGALVCWVVWPWTAAAVWSVNRSSHRKTGACE